MNADLIKKIVEGALLAAGKPLDITRIESLFEANKNDITSVLIICYHGKDCDNGWPKIFLNKKRR